MTETKQTERSVPDVAPSWDELRERAPYNADAHDNPTGGVVVHRCHPTVNARDWFAFAHYHETMKGYEQKDVYLYQGSSNRYASHGIGAWDTARDAFHVREGSHHDCAVCQGEADPRDLLREVMDKATDQVGGEHNVARSTVHDRHDGPDGIVYVDSHGMGTESGPYSVRNSTRHWSESIENHPYVQMTSSKEVGEGGNWSSPDNTLRVTLDVNYPDPVPEAEI